MSHPGPASLGRGVVVGPTGPVPAAWADAPEVVVDEPALARPADVVGALHRAWSRRTPVTVRLAIDAGRLRTPRSYPDEPWTLSADFEVWDDRLQFLVWANNYDARSDPDDPVWWWARKAQRLGASLPRPIPAGDVLVADILLPDGQPAWVDGGPRAPMAGADLGGAVIVHRESVERDRLAVAPRPVSASERFGGELAPDQLAAVAHSSGPARIIAPAGSGKTRVLTTRLRHLVVDRRWDRDAVLAVAYNKKAQQELDARAADFSPRTRTLNSLGLSILTRARVRAPGVLEAHDTRRIVEALAPVQRRRVNTDPIGPYIEALGVVRLGLRDPEEVEASRDDVPGLAAMWPAFRAELRDRNAVDFDEQVYGAIEALLADGALRANEQLACRHLLVDEFQDLTPAHVLLLRLLASPVLDCFGVGDDDQVIYGHAGADPDFLINFERLFPDAGDHPLEVNYRCPVPVVDAAVHLLSYNQRRVPKRIRAAKAEGSDDDLAGPGTEPITAGLELRLHPGGAGAADVAGVVTRWVQAGHAPDTIAVLSRVNSMLLAPHVALVEAGVPVESVVRPDLLARTGLRAALAYLRIATAADGRIAGRDIVEILRRPSRGLPPWFSDRLRRRSAWRMRGLLDIITSVPDKDAGKVERLVDDIVAIRAAAGSGTSAARLLQLVRDDIGLGGAMQLLDGGRGGEGASHGDDLEALAQVARLHEDAATLEAWLSAHLERPSDPGGVVVSTVHRVKGMEWDRVAVYGVTAGILPHRLAEDEEEERRVLHVAITRGREEVAVFIDAARPSPFVEELTGEAPHTPRLTPRNLGLGPPAPTGGRPARPSGGKSAGRPGGPIDGASGRRSPASGRGDAGESGPPGDPALEDALRAWRRQRSSQDGVPAYVVFADRTLRAIASARPATLVALRALDGIGPTKLELYGDDILALVADTPGAVGDPPAGAP